MEAQGLALTFNDVRVEPGASDFATGEIDVATRLSRNVELGAPLVSAAMDTVTTADMAISMAKLGGIGVIHCGLNKTEQRNEVRKVKLHLNGMVENPITVDPDRSVESVLIECDERGFSFRTLPVVDGNEKLLGVMTTKDFIFCKDNSKPIAKVMTPLDELIVAGQGTKLKKAHKTMTKAKVNTLPLVNNNGQLTGMYIYSDVDSIMSGDRSGYNLDENGRLRVAAAVPTSNNGLKRVKKMIDYLDVVVLDSAQGDSKFAFETLYKLKERYPHLDVVAGNISTGRSARKLVDAGADGIKVGQGPGSICTTRVETGIGKPQVSAVYDCYQAVGKEVPICADGGIVDRGDVSIALVAGASSVMMGGMLAATREAPGKTITLPNGSRVKLYRGMGSRSALLENASSRDRYGGDAYDMPLPEGIEAYKLEQGSVDPIITDILKALRKSMSYCNAGDIRRHQRYSRFERITNSGLTESRPHDVIQIQ